MTPEEKIKDIRELNEEAIVLPDFHDALIGYVRMFDQLIALYHEEKCIDALIKHGMTFDDAVEYFEYNIIGSYLGDYSPGFATFFTNETK